MILPELAPAIENAPLQQASITPERPPQMREKPAFIISAPVLYAVSRTDWEAELT
jgi:hypothetical protein